MKFFDIQKKWENWENLRLGFRCGFLIFKPVHLFKLHLSRQGMSLRLRWLHHTNHESLLVSFHRLEASDLKDKIGWYPVALRPWQIYWPACFIYQQCYTSFQKCDNNIYSKSPEIWSNIYVYFKQVHSPNIKSKWPTTYINHVFAFIALFCTPSSL